MILATRRRARTLPLALMLALVLPAGCVTPPPTPDMRAQARAPATASGPVPFTLDDNRVFVPVTLIGADGRERPTLAFVNQGFAGPALSNALYRDLGVDRGRPIRMRVGAAEIPIDPRTVQPESEVLDFQLGLLPHGRPTSLEAQAAYTAKEAQKPGGLMKVIVGPLPVGAVISAGLFLPYRVTLDYGTRTTSLEPPGGPAPQGAPVPMRVDPVTGFATVNAEIGRERHALVIDCGGSFSALRLPLARREAQAHPSWLRSQDGVGEAQVSMDGEIGVPVLRAPEARLGALTLAPFDFTGFGTTGPVGLIATPAFWNFYSAKAGERVDGWIGGNVLKSFRLTLDYPHHMSWWSQEAPLYASELDQVGLTLSRDGQVVTVAGVAHKDGRPTVAGVLPGDRLVSIDGRPVAGLTRGQLLTALRGRPGEVRDVVFSRKGTQIEVRAPVTAF